MAEKKVINGVSYFEFDGVLVPENMVAEPGAKVTGGATAAKLFQDIRFEAQEVLKVATLDSSNKVISVMEVTRGLVNRSLIHPREIFRKAIADNAARIIMAHNHPSGELTFSTADIDATKKVLLAGDIIGIELIDHILVSSKGHRSMREEGTGNFWH